MTILITGATGQVGGEAARTLASAGSPVRALVREPARAAGLSGVDFVQGSFEDDAALARAMEGVDVMFLAGRDSPDTVSQLRHVLEHARRSGIRHVVKLSAIGAAADSPVELMRDHYIVDELLLESSLDWTLLKPHLFMQNLLRTADSLRSNGRLAAPMGDEKFPLVDTRDVGQAAALILANPAGHVGQTYRLTGPERYSYDDVAAALSGVVGRPVTYEPVAPADFEARLLAAGIPAWRAFDLAHIASAYTAVDHAVSPDFKALTGHDPRSLSIFLQDYREAFAI